MSHRRQHFVPQFYLRHFGAPGGSSVGVYVVDEKRHVLSAPIVSQAQEKYLYGRDGRVERDLALMEEAAGAAIDRLLSPSSAPPTLADMDAIQAFVLFQHMRTPTMARTMRQMMDGVTREVFDAAGFGRDAEAAVERTNKQAGDPVQENLQLVYRVLPSLRDLQACIFRSVCGLEFITSSAPVVLHNQWLQGASGPFGAGLTSAGLQVFAPLSSGCLLLLFDSDVYRVVNGSRGSVNLSEASDVESLNALQLASRPSVLYYSGADGTRAMIDRLVHLMPPQAAPATHVDHLETADGRKHLVISRFAFPRIPVDVSVVRVLDRKRRVPMKERALSLRPRSLLASGERVPTDLLITRRRGPRAPGRVFWARRKNRE